MTYYFVSLESSEFSSFQERFPALAEGGWITSADELDAALSEGKQGVCYFVDFAEQSKEIDKWVMKIRAASPESRIIYVTVEQKAAELKTHQLSPVGGDAYVSRHVTPDTLERILSGFRNEFTNLSGNKLEKTAVNRVSKEFEMESLMSLKEDSLSLELDRIFEEAIPQKKSKPKFQSLSDLAPDSDPETGEPMSDKDQELSLDDLGDLEISETPDLPEETSEEADAGLDMELDAGMDLNLDDGLGEPPTQDQKSDLALGELDLGGGEDFSLEETSGAPAATPEDNSLVLSDATSSGMDFSLGGEISPDAKEKLAEIDAIMEEDSKLHNLPEDMDLMGEAADLMTNTGKPSLDAVEAEGDALDLGGIDDSLALDDLGGGIEDVSLDASEVAAESELEDQGFAIADIPAAGTDDVLNSDLDQPLVSDDLDLANLDFGSESEDELTPAPTSAPVKEELEAAPAKEEKAPARSRKKKDKEEKETARGTQAERPLGEELREISGAYSAELERMQATLSNLRADREELLAKIQTLEEEKLLQNRQVLSIRAELDEKKIELSIVRKKLNEDISELKDRLRLEEERRLILEEKNRVQKDELEKSAQKNKFDVKKVQLRERELEQRLELLKADAETQIRNRDLKILELKRKIDGMEFDMESMQSQEKRTVESRFELEDKLEKAIKTLRNAISVLEDEPDKGAALDALKKNIDM